jgi:regulatory protein
MAETTARPPRGRRPLGPLKKSSLENAALYYLERYAASVEGLRRVLARRVEKAAREERCDREEASAWVAEIVERFARSGLGDSAKRIQAELREKGVDASIITGALAEEDGDDASAAELEAAWRLARRRRLGPYRAADQRADARNRDLAALGRAGFGFSTAKAVVDADEPPEGGIPG